MSTNDRKSHSSLFFIEKAEHISQRYPNSRTSVYIEFKGSRKKVTATLEAMGFEKRFDLYSKNAMIGTFEFKPDNAKNIKELLSKGELQAINPLGILEDF